MQKLKIGLIGFGSWLRNAYLPALTYDGRAVITAVTASSEKTRQCAHQILGDDVIVYDNYEELLSGAELDAVMIAVPDRVHQAALTAAIEAGIPVFYEPPLSDTRERIKTMTERLITAPQLTFAHLELCFHPGIAQAVTMIEKKTIGLLQNVTITLHADWGCPSDSDLCLIDRMSCWYVQILNRIMDSIPKRVMVLDGYGNTGRMQSTSMGIYDYDGVWGIIKANVNCPEDESILIEISGDEGDISINYFTGELRFRSRQHPEWSVIDSSPLKPYANWPAVRETVSAFLDLAERKEAGSGNAKEVAQLSLIGLAADESKDTGTWADIKQLSCLQR